MKHYILKTVAALAAVSAAFSVDAQDLDPTVVVDRAYEGHLIEVHKPQLQMAVPDSVMQFALDFDYSVFESPYKGSYEFSPYLLSLKPEASGNDSGVLYLNAGAGYGLHPVFDAVWSPRLGRRFGVDVYAGHRSYVGNWWNIGPENQGDHALLDRTGGSWYGYDLKTDAGADFRYDWNKGVLSFGIGYDGIAVRERSSHHSFNAMTLDFSLSSKVTRDNGFVYKVDASWLYGGDCAHGAADFSRLTENLFTLNAVFGPAFRDTHRMLFDVGVDLVGYGGLKNAGTGQFHIVPHYTYRKGRLYLDFGVRFAKILDSDPDDGAYDKAERLEQMVYPDITFEWVAVPDALKFRARVGGGNRLNTFSSLLGKNHHFNIAVPLASQLDYSIERISAEAGFEGRLTSRLSYEVKGGYVCYGNGILDAVDVDEPGNPVYSTGYGGWHKGFAALGLAWKNESLSIDGSVRYSHAWGDAFGESSRFLRPAALEGSLSAEYNWKRRIFAGVGCGFATSRDGSSVSVPGYADLRIYAEYAASRRLSFWLNGGNLLGMTIQRTPLYAEKGPYFTLGLTFKY